MALRTTNVLKNAMGSLGCRLSCIRCVHAAPAPLENAMARPIENQFVFPGCDREVESDDRIEVPTFGIGGSMELMAVPKKKISKFRRGIRNGPKALKPIPVIIRCRGKKL
ncbi:uncharacterized protein LOC113304702 isoform X2 [Papaver somniferum]|uniref:uncharacterized protein LOC113304702 isoform X2 n=1 Tax=Papaver somniferum TaxID=3469 RepID=UPI000E705C59|nr:uncharacterized protein LOC113304702 isoform X2 [Papaver somniferum]